MNSIHNNLPRESDPTLSEMLIALGFFSFFVGTCVALPGAVLFMAWRCLS